MKKPKVKLAEELNLTDVNELRNKIQEYIDFLHTAEEDDEQLQEKYENPVWEAAIELFCGKEIWDDFINTKFI